MNYDKTQTWLTGRRKRDWDLEPFSHNGTRREMSRSGTSGFGLRVAGKCAILASLILGSSCALGRAAVDGVLTPGAKLQKAGEGFQFTEGPAADARGDVYFTDIPANRIHKWTTPQGIIGTASKESPAISVFRDQTNGANGLFTDSRGHLFICEGGSGRVISVDPAGQNRVGAATYEGKRFNRPNDLWLDPRGGVYFSDPVYGSGARPQGGEHVYYVSADRRRIVRVIDDMVRPNGLIGTPDGKTLYVADHGAKATYRYSINPDGTLTGKTLFASTGSDGMTMDADGNVYLTTDAVLVFSPAGRQIERIEIPERPTNVTFAGPHRRTLFVTARSTVYTLEMAVRGAR
jgi:gluconolactonase